MKPFQFSIRDKAAPISVEGYRALARKSLPKMIWAYLDGGAEDLATLVDNRQAFSHWRLNGHVLQGIKTPILSSVIAGTNVALPIGLAPTGLSGLIHSSGDVASARAAEKAGTRLILSTASSYSLEEVAQATADNHWFQLYPYSDRDRVGALIKRARAAGYTALFVTVDVPVMGNREGERLTGMGVPIRLTPGRCLDFACHPRWISGFLRHKRVAAIHYMEPAEGGTIMDQMKRDSAAAARSIGLQARYMQGDLDWDDLAWIRDQWEGRLYVKGVMHPDDAAQSVDKIGADGVVVSNHGGRQLNKLPGTLDALPSIVERIGGRAEVYLDGGVRRGTDVIAALCLGAKGVFIGRPYLYGLAANGQDGASAILSIFREEMERALILMGCKSVADLNKSYLFSRSDEHNVRLFSTRADNVSNLDDFRPVA